MDHFAAVALRPGAALGDHAADVALLDCAAADRPLHVQQPAFRLTAGEVDGDLVQPGVGHILGLADGGADRTLRLVQVDDAAAAHALAAVPAEAEHAQAAVGFLTANQADNLGAADIEHAHRTGTAQARTWRIVCPGLGGGSRRWDISFKIPLRS